MRTQWVHNSLKGRYVGGIFESKDVLGQVMGVSVLKKVPIDPVLDDFAVGREIGGDDGFAVTQGHHENPAVVDASVG